MGLMPKKKNRSCSGGLRNGMLLILLLLAAIFSFSQSVLATDALNYKLPEIQKIPGMETQWIARQMVMNGVPMSMQSFSVGRDADEVLNYYERHWKAKGLGRVIKKDFGGEKSIGLEHRGNYYTVQVHDAEAGAEGMLTVSQTLADAKISRDTDFPLMSGSDVLTKVESNDFGQIAETLMVENDNSITSNAIYFVNTLRGKGWVLQPYADNDSGNSARVLNFQKDDQLCQITIAEQSSEVGAKRTAVVVNWIKKQ